MAFSFIRVVSRLSTPLMKKHTRQFTHLCSGIKYPPPAKEILRRWFCEKPEDLYAAINENDFEVYEETTSYKDVDFEKIAKGDPETIQALKQIQLEIDIYAQEGGLVPSQISSNHWLELLSLRTLTQRKKHIRHLWLTESRKVHKKQKQELYRNELETHKTTREVRTNLCTNSPVEYGLLRTTLFHRFYEPDMKKLYNFRLLQAEMFGPHLIIDCGYDEYMSAVELSLCVKDMLKSWSNNREHFDPFDMIFCNLNKNSEIFPRLCGVLPAIERDPACPFNHTDKHYLDLYPKEKLVYLTPHSNEVMESYDGDSIYIIGGLFDKSKDMALSLAKAKKDGIRKVKLPLDKYLKWNYGKKTLSVTNCVNIISDLKDGRSWDFAFRYLRERQRVRNDLFDDGKDVETNTKTAAHFEELRRRKNVYDMLLTPKAKKN